MKRHNYFDDDCEEYSSEKSSIGKNVSAKDIGKKIVKALRYAISVIGVNFLIFSKKVLRFLTSRTKKKSAVALGITAILITMAIIITTVSVTITASSDSQKSKYEEFASSAYKICSQYSEKYGTANYKFMNNEYDIKGCMLTGLCIAREIDFNNDYVPELLLGYNDNDTYTVEIWGFHGKDFMQLYTGKPLQRSNREYDIWFGIYSDKEDYFLAQHSGDMAENVSILKLSGDTFKEKTTCEYDESTISYIMNKKNVTDDFERVRFAVLRESTAENTVDATLTAIDYISDKAVKENDESSKDDKEKVNPMYTAYYSLVEEYNEEYGVCELITDVKKPDLSGLASVELIDFNNDGTEELMLIYQKEISERKQDKNGDYISIPKNEYFCDIYAYNGEKPILVYQNEGLSNYMDDTESVYMLIKKDGDEKKLCFNTFSYSERSNMKAVSKIVSFDGERFETEKKYTVTKDYGYYKFMIDGENSYRSKFINDGGYSVPFFDGTKSYDSSEWEVLYFKVDEDNLSQIKNQPSNTEENIKILNPSYSAKR